MVLELLKPKGKKSGDSGDGSAIVFSAGGGSGSGGGSDSGWGADRTWDPPTYLPWVVKKVKLPEFSGFDPQGWINKANLYFDINGTSDELRLRLAQLSMVGVAQHWFTIITQVRPSLSWLEFQSELLQRFSGLEVQNPYEQLATIKQGDSILDYIDDFEYLLSLVPRLPESQALGYFVAGLNEEVRRWVRLHQPQSRLDAMNLARDVVQMLNPDDVSGSSSCFRYYSRSGSQYSSMMDGLTLLGRHDSLSLQSSDTGTKGVASGSASLRPSFSPKSQSMAAALGGQLFHHDRGSRSLSRTEYEDRRKRGYVSVVASNTDPRINVRRTHFGFYFWV
jgi:hypothetical protein